MAQGKRFDDKENKGKRFRSEKFKKTRKILVILLLISLIYITYYFWNSKKEQEETDKLLDSIEIDISNQDEQEMVTERMLKVSGLKEQYPDIVAWLEIADTNISYPVMQGADNDFYVNHDYKGENSIRGSIFLDKGYNWSIPSNNLLLYGHNNSKDGTMFADLLKYKNEDFYKEHSTIRFTTPEEDKEYEIISVFLSRIYYKSETDVYRWYYFIDAENEEKYNEYIEYIKESSLYNIEETAEYGEQLLTLVTCEYSNENGRLAVVAKRKN